MDESSLSPIRPSSSSPPKSSTTVSIGFEIYQMGGIINNDKQPSSAVRVLDCRTHTWRDAPNITVARKGAHSAFIDGKIYVIGGTEGSMNWVEVFDLKTQTWKPLPLPLPFPSLSDDAKVDLCRGELYATSEGKRYAYDFKAGRWEKVYLCPERTSGPWCVVIENVKFCLSYGRFKWYDSKRRNWFTVEGLEDLYKNHLFFFKSTTVRLANHGGKLVFLWDEQLLLESPVADGNKYVCENKRIWCAVISLEKRIGFSGLEIWGEIERLNAVLTVPKSYKVVICITL